MRFIHITDTHLGPTADFRLYGRDPCANMALLVDRINALQFEVDFILHTGDVTDDGAEASYRLFESHCDRLKFPIRYAIGNHDDLAPMRAVLLGGSCGTAPRLDYQFEIGGVEFCILDTRGPIPPGGHLYDEQLHRIESICETKTDQPLVVVVHHQPVDLDTPWLDDRARTWPRDQFMRLDNGDAFLRAIAPAGPTGTARLRGVFFGHVHTPFVVVRDGILFSSGASSFAQLTTGSDCDDVKLAEHEPVGFNVVTISGTQTLVRAVRYAAASS